MRSLPTRRVEAAVRLYRKRLQQSETQQDAVCSCESIDEGSALRDVCTAMLIDSKPVYDYLVSVIIITSPANFWLFKLLSFQHRVPPAERYHCNCLGQVEVVQRGVTLCRKYCSG